LGAEWFDGQGNLLWPPNQGASGGWQKTILQPGMIIDRYGTASGSYFSPRGTSFNARALPSDAMQANFHTNRVIKPLDVRSSQVAEWFGQSGGGIQLLSEHSARSLVEQGFLEEIK